MHFLGKFPLGFFSVFFTCFRHLQQRHQSQCAFFEYAAGRSKFFSKPAYNRDICSEVDVHTRDVCASLNSSFEQMHSNNFRKRIFYFRPLFSRIRRPVLLLHHRNSPPLSLVKKKMNLKNK